ncbi:tRNA methyltransferase 2 [Rhizophlyctis rosea]|uniref:tRNA methyltransferase 2 n=1 Tax=Rhizophlyctis rosea TaxID=64517 RepID=A0AAD5X643_9FUNG|nr:tRNA methyltransferase 2 [Rhizophlyctis rosea]
MTEMDAENSSASIVPAKRSAPQEEAGPFNSAESTDTSSPKKQKTTENTDTTVVFGGITSTPEVAPPITEATPEDTEMGEAPPLEPEDGEIPGLADAEPGEDVTAPRPRIMVFNLPKCGNKEVRKFLKNKLGLDETEITVKKDPKKNNCILACKDDDHKKKVWKAIEEGPEFKKNKLELADPREPRERQKDFLEKQKHKKEGEEAAKRSPEEQINDQVTPLWKMPYELQLEAKERDMYLAVKKIKGKLMNFLPAKYKERIPDMKKKAQEDKDKHAKEAEALAAEREAKNGGEEDVKVPMEQLVLPKLQEMAEEWAEQMLLEEEMPKAHDRLEFRNLRDLGYLPEMYVFHAWNPTSLDDSAGTRADCLASRLKKTEGLPCKMDKIVASPVVDNYRNKCEFSFGRNLDDKVAVGFLLGLYKEGKINVLEPTKCRNVPPAALKIAKVTQEFLRLPGRQKLYHRVDKEGFWRMMLVRTFDSGENMVLVSYNPGDKTKEVVYKELQALREHYKAAREAEKEEDRIQIHSLLVQEHAGAFNGILSLDQAKTWCIDGRPWVYEELLGLRFRVSAGAFFQINSPATECLYSIVRDWCVNAVDAVSSPNLEGDDGQGPSGGHSPSKKDKGKGRVDAMGRPVDKYGFRRNSDPDFGKVTKTNLPAEKVDDLSKITIADICKDEKRLKEGVDMSDDRAVAALAQQKLVKSEGATATPGKVKVKTEGGEEKKNVVLLDLCCGTGTIGITMASKVKRVIGVEMVKAAIDDAKFNATLNGVNNVEYYCGKVEDVIQKVLSTVEDEDEVVAVLDPPRAGVHADVIKAVRNRLDVKRIVFVSCDANAAFQNFVDLMRPESNKFKHRPFRMTRLQPVDLFPHTKHCELVVEFTRAPREIA